MSEIIHRTIYCKEGCGKRIDVETTRLAYAKLHRHEKQCNGGSE